ncbi:hypothetical protein JOQ06_006920 [Pogonophryne albipinna]|uniref:Uncharacterized protein n=1 Tax=Pogonophryne albipinna TaxID=1090488 RepID=A0AAD6B0M7_9TELE|nr:hypothetical protein JOQ06_006920 [Pogonophryne albipinna]
MITRTDLNSKLSHLCIAEQTAEQVEQTKQGVCSPLLLLHIRRGSVTMTGVLEAALLIFAGALSPLPF